MNVADLNRLALRSTPTNDLAEGALLLASEKNLSACDACYAVLAGQLDLPLITADKPLVGTIEWAIFVGDLDVKPYAER